MNYNEISSQDMHSRNSLRYTTTDSEPLDSAER